MRRIQAGDDAAWPALVERLGPMVWGVAGKFLPAQEQEDAFQEIWLAIYRGIGAYRGIREAKFSTFAYAIAVRICLKVRNRLGRRPRTVDPATLDLLESDEIEGPASAEQKERADLLRACLSELSPSQQRLLTRRYDKGMEPVEIAAALDMKPGTVRVGCKRARDSLRGHLACLGP